MATIKPAEVFPPGEFIRDELEARNWTQADLAGIMARPVQAINEFISGRRGITPETAKELAAAFGTSAEFWMNLESAYRLSLAPDDGDIARRAKLYTFAPVKEMLKRGWIKQPKTVNDLEEELKAFFDVHSLDDRPQLSAVARKSTTYSSTSQEQLAWAFRVKNLGRIVQASRFKHDDFEQGLSALRHFLTHEADIQRVPKVLAGLGVRLVIVEHLPKTRIDGVTLWLNQSSPVIGLSLRFDRIDHFWFTLFHELIHVLYGDALSIDENLVGEQLIPLDQKPENEQRADREAAERLIPTSDIESFILRVGPLYYRTKVMQFANRIQVHPGIIVGQLQRRHELQYSQLRDSLVKIRHLLTGVMMDGWGFSPDIS